MGGASDKEASGAVMEPITLPKCWEWVRVEGAWRLRGPHGLEGAVEGDGMLCVETRAWERAWSEACRDAAAHLSQEASHRRRSPSGRLAARRAAALCEAWAFDPAAAAVVRPLARRLSLSPSKLARALQRAARTLPESVPELVRSIESRCPATTEGKTV